MKVPKGRIEKILDGLEQQSSLLTTDEIKAELRERGIDVDRLTAQTRELVRQHLKVERTAWMQEADHRKSLIEAASSQIASWLDRTEEEIRAAFAALSGSGRAAVAFRNQGDLTVQDMARILDKQEQLKKLSQ